MTGSPKPTVRAQLDVSERRPSRLDEDGRERPEFLTGFPADPELEELSRAFEAGNYALIRKKAPQLAARTSDPAVKAAALELRRRIDPDPVVLKLLAIALGLLVFLVAWTYLAH